MIHVEKPEYLLQPRWNALDSLKIPVERKVENVLSTPIAI